MSAPSNGPAAVLAALRPASTPRDPATDGIGPAVSGEKLSTLLGVSRAQIWKHVRALRTRGYQIDGAPGGGYRLVARPDRLYAEEIQLDLATRWVGQRLEHLDETDSTNRVAFDLGREGVAAGTTVIAEAQNAGRGRLGRSFYSPPHQNLYTSIVLRPEGSIAEAATLILAAAVAVAETIAETLDDEDAVEIKWPNDVLIHRRKTSGILMESSAEGTRLAFAILGIGINLNVDRATFPDEFRESATSLSSELGRRIDRVAFTRALLEHLERSLDAHAAGGFDAVRPRFESFFRMRGESIGAEELRGGRIEGVARGIAADGALEIERTDGPRAGEMVRLLAGDVTLAKREAPGQAREPTGAEREGVRS